MALKASAAFASSRNRLSGRVGAPLKSSALTLEAAAASRPICRLIARPIHSAAPTDTSRMPKPTSAVVHRRSISTPTSSRR